MKIFIFLLAIFLNTGCDNTEKKITEILVKKVDLNIDTAISVDCANFDIYFKKIIKVSQIRNEIVFKKMQLIIKELKFTDEIKNIDTRQKVIIFYSDNSKDVLCIDRFGMTINGKSILIDKDAMNFILKLGDKSNGTE